MARPLRETEKAFPQALRPRFFVWPIVRRSSCLRHQNALTEKAWGEAIQGAPKSSPQQLTTVELRPGLKIFSWPLWWGPRGLPQICHCKLFTVWPINKTSTWTWTFFLYFFLYSLSFSSRHKEYKHFRKLSLQLHLQLYNSTASRLHLEGALHCCLIASRLPRHLPLQRCLKLGKKVLWTLRWQRNNHRARKERTLNFLINRIFLFVGG